ncbi:MAG TPA: hypothetical protein VHZ51_05685 [Ktedonobacteraceae bacterium]|jgi:hypothetical protein|nr:hypothetical protein [Ktedonobacteraceae bacterium]
MTEPRKSGGEHFSLPIGEWIAALGECCNSQVRINDSLASHHTPKRNG